MKPRPSREPMFSRILFSIRLMTSLAPESSGIDVESEQNGQ